MCIPADVGHLELLKRCLPGVFPAFTQGCALTVAYSSDHMLGTLVVIEMEQ